jgi:hypothetical protein
VLEFVSLAQSHYYPLKQTFEPMQQNHLFLTAKPLARLAERLITLETNNKRQKTPKKSASVKFPSLRSQTIKHLELETIFNQMVGTT